MRALWKEYWPLAPVISGGGFIFYVLVMVTAPEARETPARQVVALAASSTTPVGCTRPVGAIPDDGLDDRVALQAAIDAATSSTGPGCLDLPEGVYHASASAQGYASLIVRAPLVMRGPGTLAMLGPARTGDSGKPGDWVLLEVQGNDVTIEGVSFDGSARTITGEQTHLLQIKGPSSHVTVRSGRFNLPPGLTEAGDCIRLMGEFHERVRDVVLTDLYMPACFRSGVALQRGVENVTIYMLETVWVGDQAIDVEPTGNAAFGCAPIVSGLSIYNSVLRRSVDRGITVAIAGDQCATTDDVKIKNTIIEDGGIDLIDVGKVILSGLRLENAPGWDAQPTLLARGYVGSLTVHDSVILRSPHERPHPVIQVSALGGRKPSSVHLSKLLIMQATRAAGIRVEGLGSLTMRDSVMVYASDGNDWAVSGSVGRATVVDTTMRGSWRGLASMPVTELRVNQEETL